MSVASVSNGFTPESFARFLSRRSEPTWLSEQRRAAWDSFANRNWPARNEEEWIRTDIRLFKLGQFDLPGSAEANPASEAVPAPLLAEGVNLGGQATSIAGLPAGASLAQKWAEKGVLCGSLDELASTHGDLIQKHLFTRAIDPHYDRFSALHAAAWSGGFLVYVPPRVVIDQPLHLYSVLPKGAADLGHTLVILDEGAEASVLCETASTSPDGAGLHCGATEVLVGNGARLRLVSLQNWNHHTWHFAHQKAVVGRDALLQWTIAAMGGRLAKVNQHVELVGRGAESQVNGVLFSEGKQHLSYHTLQHHMAPQCRSNFLYKSALQDKSRTVWRGMIKVDPLAQKTDGYQRNDNLLLSGDARADSIPGLEIEADDVRCTHGSTSGKVDEELVFYAQTRGLSRKEATRLIVSGFFQQIFDRVTIDSVRDALAHAIHSRVREYQ